MKKKYIEPMAETVILDTEDILSEMNGSNVEVDIFDDEYEKEAGWDSDGW